MLLFSQFLYYNHSSDLYLRDCYIKTYTDLLKTAYLAVFLYHPSKKGSFFWTSPLKKGPKTRRLRGGPKAQKLCLAPADIRSLCDITKCLFSREHVFEKRAELLVHLMSVSSLGAKKHWLSEFFIQNLVIGDTWSSIKF